MAAHGQFHRVGDDIARDERGFHALMAHGDAVGHRDGAEFTRRAMGCGDALLHGLRLAHERDVAGRSFVPAGGHADQRLANLVLRQTHRVEIGAMRRTLRPGGHIATGQFGFVEDLGVHKFRFPTSDGFWFKAARPDGRTAMPLRSLCSGCPREVGPKGGKCASPLLRAEQLLALLRFSHIRGLPDRRSPPSFDPLANMVSGRHFCHLSEVMAPACKVFVRFLQPLPLHQHGKLQPVKKGRQTWSENDARMFNQVTSEDQSSGEPAASPRNRVLPEQIAPRPERS
jgi:hypothetical protein